MVPPSIEIGRLEGVVHERARKIAMRDLDSWGPTMKLEAAGNAPSRIDPAPVLCLGLFSRKE
jgi:hypothetical protein